MFITRAYNTFEIDSLSTVLTKKSKDKKLKDEIKYLISLPENIAMFFPRIIKYGIIKDNYYVKMENYAYRTLGDIMVNWYYDENLWNKISSSLDKIRKIFTTHTQCMEKNTFRYQREMYIKKTEEEYKKLIKSSLVFEIISNHKYISINNYKYKNFEIIWYKIRAYIYRKLISRKDAFSVIHGDLCFSNILCGHDDKSNSVIIKFIDPRGSFGKKWIYGDPLYDTAKLRHSYEGGYEYMIYDKFSIKASGNYRLFKLAFDNDNKNKIKDVFVGDTKDTDSKLVEGLIFIGMCARHYDSIDRQIAMYITGVRLLNEVVTELGL